MNRKTALGRDCAASSWSASAANRVSATESLFAAIINRLLQQNRHEADIRRCPLRVAIGGKANLPQTLRYCVFGSLHWPSPDDLPSRLRLEYCWFLREWIDAAPLRC